VRDPCDVLCIPRDADEETIRRAYRRLVKVYHPDLSRDEKQAAKNSRLLEEVMDAYQRLLTRHPRSSVRPTAPPRGASKASNRGTRRPQVDPERWARYGELLISGKDPSIRALAAKTLGDMGRRAAFGYLRQAFRDSDDRVVCEAVRAVGRIGVRQARNELLALFPLRSVAVKHAILDCIEEIGALEDYGTLFQLALRDRNESLRARGLHLLARYQKVRGYAGKPS
jgi:HEAT repeat protein